MAEAYACNMNALDKDERARHGDLARRIRPAVTGFRELDDGYAACFAWSRETMLVLAEFVTLERLCCPFFTLSLVSRPEALELQLTGPDGIKPFIRMELGIAGS